MAPQYELHAYNASGIKQAIVTDALTVQMKRTVNAVSVLTVQMSALAYNAQFFAMNNYIEFYRSDPDFNITKYVEFAGIILITETTYATDTVITVVVASFNVLLANRIVAYKSGLTNLSTFSAQPAETILKRLFDYNVGAQATTANGRYSNGVITGATSSATTGAGNTTTVSCSNQNLLLAMQKIQQTAGGDFDVVYTAPSTYTFTWYTGQQGTNRTSTVIFSIANGSLGKLVITENRLNEFTVAHVGGQGEGSARTVVSRPASLPTGLSAKEYFVDARNETTSAGYSQLGDMALEDVRRNTSFVQAVVLQSNSLRYGRDYFLGDRVSVFFNDVTYTYKVNGIDIKYQSSGEEVINVELVVY